jgi:hypothetical protein
MRSRVNDAPGLPMYDRAGTRSAERTGDPHAAYQC